MTASEPSTAEIDLTSCEREQIHKLGRVQSFGFLIGASLDWTICCASENVAGYLGRPAPEIVGESLAAVLGEESLHTIRNRMQFLRGQESTEQARGLQLPQVEQRFDCSIHICRNQVMLEFEPSPEAGRDDDIATVRTVMGRLGQSAGVQRLCDDAARCLQALVGFDRVMVYRFHQDGTGEVVAEAKKRHLEPFLHLRYPASDIPPQARRLYLSNPIRIIADVGDPGVALYPAQSPEGDAPDLSQSVLRSVSPIHLEYLVNMGVAASMSISIIVEGRLWGLFACHHGRPIVLSQGRRSAADLFGQMFSLILSGKQTEEENRNDDEVRRLTNAFTSSVGSAGSPFDDLMPLLRDFAPLVAADGAAAVVDGEVSLEGATPTAEEIGRLVKFLNRATGNTVYTSSELSAVLPAAADFVQRAAGVLAIPVSRSPRDYILFFRKEAVKTVTWAGNPDKPVTVGPQGVRLTPRKSFEAWQSTVEGQSEPWMPSDLRAASQLRLTVLEVVLRLTDEVSRERRSAQQRQELLVAELNHRVRNILGLVRGLISQSRSDELTTAEYVGVLNSRIQALARAHDQITRKNWAASSFFELLHTEVKSYLLDKAGRVVLEGDDCLLEPVAFSTVALVMHELVTNAAKYGALSDRHGRIDVRTALTDAGDLTIEWCETGGPVVRAPNRRGFGSTIVERSVPFELNGTAEIDFHLSGLRARFTIPAAYVRPSAGSVAWRAGNGANDDGQAGLATAPAAVLVVEDNLIIGLEAERLFQELGSARVEVVSNLEEAERALAETPFDFVLLDVNLAEQTSFGLAQDLLERGQAFAFATGYGDSAGYPDALRDLPRIAKPYDMDVIVKLLAAMAGAVRVA